MNKLVVHSERGAIMVITGGFMLMVGSLLALAIDMYFSLQSRLDEQNVGEFFTLSALGAYYEPASDPNDFVERRTNSLTALQEVQSSNEILGLGSSSIWSFDPNSCSGAVCTGAGWTVTFGQWDGASFTPAAPVSMGDPDSIDTGNVDAVLLELEIPSGSSVMSFFSGGDDYGHILQVSALAYSLMDGGQRKFRQVKHSGGGFAL